ncbi:hypothetical protein RYX36_006172, partial [Vicia faba]
KPPKPHFSPFKSQHYRHFLNPNQQLSLGHSNQLSTIELSAFLSAWLTGVINLMPFSALN